MALIFKKKVENALHLADSPDWYTPVAYSECARQVMGNIDLDPASDAMANAAVKADQFYTSKDNGLTKLWQGNVFVNPPGGSVNAFWMHLMHSFLGNGPVFQFVWIGYSLEQLQTLQVAMEGKLPTPLDFSICFLKKRIAFVENAARRAARIKKLLAQGKDPKEKSSPSHANYICYGGPYLFKFQDVFGPLGVVKLSTKVL